MVIWRLAITGFFLVLLQAHAGSPIEVGEDRLLSVTGPALPLAESNLSVNPDNPKQLAVGVIQINSVNGFDRTCVAWASFDGAGNGRDMISRLRRAAIPGA